MIHNSPPADIDAIPDKLPPLPAGVIFGGFQNFRLDRLWVFSDRVTGGTFYLPQETTAEQLVAEVSQRRAAFTRGSAPRALFLRTMGRPNPEREVRR